MCVSVQRNSFLVFSSSRNGSAVVLTSVVKSPSWLIRPMNECRSVKQLGNSSVTHVTFFQFFYFHWATIKHLVDKSNKFKAYDDLGVQLYITT